MIAIYEPLYAPGQTLREPAFLPLPVRNTRPGWREVAIIVDMYRQGLHRQQALTGLFSPKFRKKVGISGADLIRHIEAHPGADVYLADPAAQLATFSYNVWSGAEFTHPGLTRSAQALLDACGIGWRLEDTPRQRPERVCYGNYWVGTEKFWDDYIGGILNPIAEFLERHPDSDTARMALTPTYHYHAAPFLPFIGERLFSTFLSHGNHAVVPYLRNPLDACLFDFERDIVMFIGARVKRADREGHFPPDLIAWMDLLCRLRQRYRLAYYAHQRHPWSGDTVDAVLMEIGIAGIDAIPIKPLP